MWLKFIGDENKSALKYGVLYRVEVFTHSGLIRVKAKINQDEYIEHMYISPRHFAENWR